MLADLLAPTLSPAAEAVLDAAILGAIGDDGAISDVESPAILSALVHLQGLEYGDEDVLDPLIHHFAEATERIGRCIEEGGLEAIIDSITARLKAPQDREEALYAATLVALVETPDGDINAEMNLLRVLAYALDVRDSARLESILERGAAEAKRLRDGIED